MLDTILATKIKMSQAFKNNKRVPVTLLQSAPCVVTQIKTDKKDGYWAVQLGMGSRRTKNISKPVKGHLKGVTKQNLAPRFLREVHVDSDPGMKIGDTVSVAQVFSEGDTIAITGVSKGKGFAGGIKRWGFAGGPKTHGQSDRHRAPGSIGQGSTPGRVWKGKKMAGRMGSDRTTIQNLKVVSVDPEKNILAVSGPVPGTKGTLIIARRTSSRKEKTNE